MKTTNQGEEVMSEVVKAKKLTFVGNAADSDPRCFEREAEILLDLATKADNKEHMETAKVALKAEKENGEITFDEQTKVHEAMDTYAPEGCFYGTAYCENQKDVDMYGFWPFTPSLEENYEEGQKQRVKEALDCLLKYLKVSDGNGIEDDKVLKEAELDALFDVAIRVLAKDTIWDRRYMIGVSKNITDNMDCWGPELSECWSNKAFDSDVER